MAAPQILAGAEARLCARQLWVTLHPQGLHCSSRGGTTGSARQIADELAASSCGIANRSEVDGHTGSTCIGLPFVRGSQEETNLNDFVLCRFWAFKGSDVVVAAMHSTTKLHRIVLLRGRRARRKARYCHTLLRTSTGREQP